VVVADEKNEDKQKRPQTTGTNKQMKHKVFFADSLTLSYHPWPVGIFSSGWAGTTDSSVVGPDEGSVIVSAGSTGCSGFGSETGVVGAGAGGSVGWPGSTGSETGGSAG